MRTDNYSEQQLNLINNQWNKRTKLLMILIKVSLKVKIIKYINKLIYNIILTFIPNSNKFFMFRNPTGISKQKLSMIYN